MTEGTAYQSRLAAERSFFKDCVNVHDLPDIFHYWSNKYVLPKLQALGFAGSVEFMIDPIQWQCERNPGQVVRCLSLGAGNCDQEIQIALQLRARGFSEFQIECLDLNEAMLERGREAAAQQGLSDNFAFASGDFNLWRPTAEYDVVLAIQALHHVVELEHLFAAIKEGLKPSGVFVVSDMIGRNGHMRWPEALSIVQEFWRKLPPSYRYNQQLDRYEEQFEDWDCSQDGFEGIRAQDILPLLNSNFHFQRFLAFANVIDPFIERSFGHHFDAAAEWDLAFIDAVHQRDEEEMRKGTIKPTHVFAILGTQRAGETWFQEPLSPSFCIRLPDAAGGSTTVPSPELYAWDEYPHDKIRELQIACDHLSEAQRKIQRANAMLDKCEQELQDRTAWALKLSEEVMYLRKTLGKTGLAALHHIDAFRARLGRLKNRAPKP